MKRSEASFSVSVVIPAYNNEGSIRSELNECRRLLGSLGVQYEIIVGDDMSSDRTREILTKYFLGKKDFKIILQCENLGIAGNIRSLYSKAANQFILLYSADGDWGVENIRRLLERLGSTGADIVVGKRERKLGYTPSRRFVSFCYNLLPRIAFGVNTEDAGSIKLFRRDLLSSIEIVSAGVFQDAEFLIKASWNGKVIVSCPVSYNKKNKSRRSSVNFSMVTVAVKDFLRIFQERLQV